MGRFTLQTQDLRSYHPLLPALNLSKEEMNALLNGAYKLKLDSTPKQMVNFVRYKVDENLKEVGACITGANFLLSDEGGVVLTENEGNKSKAAKSLKISRGSLYYQIKKHEFREWISSEKLNRPIEA